MEFLENEAVDLHAEDVCSIMKGGKCIHQAGADLKGFRAPMESLGSTGGPGEPPVDLGQKKFLNCLLVKMQVANIFYFNINNYQIFFSFLSTYNL